MKTLRLTLAFIVLAVSIVSCQKDFSFEAGNAKGSLGKTTAGDCDPIFVGGIFYQDTVMKSSNFVDVQIDFTKIGTYTIKTDTVNGYSFSIIGNTGTLGVNTVRLFAKGKPLAPGFDIFTVKFDGTQCTFNSQVIVGTGGGGGGGTAAVFSFGGAPTTCAPVTLGGTYTSGVAMVAANTVTIPVTVTTLGTYSITTIANGVTFSSSPSSMFTALGAGTIILTATGTPPTSATPVSFNYPINSGTSACSFDVPYAATPAGGAAVFTYTCTPPNINGSYTTNVAMGPSNTISVPVNVTTVGSYNNIIIGPVNGVTFSSGTGFLMSLGASSITLTASGTPTIAAAPFTNFPVPTCASSTDIAIPVALDGTLSFVNGGMTKSFNFIQVSDSAVEAPFPPLPGGFSITVVGKATAGAGLEQFEFTIFRPNTYFVNASTYSINSLASFIVVDATYTTTTGAKYNVQTDIVPQTPNFTITINTITPTRVLGSFSGATLTGVSPTTGTYIIQSGMFDLPLQ